MNDMHHLSGLDATLSQRFSLSPKSSWWPAVRFTAHLGDAHYIFGGLGLILLLDLLWTRSNLSWGVLSITASILVALGLVTLIKYAVRRERPRPPGEFVLFPYDAYSFPSGHSARLAALAVSTLHFSSGIGWALVLLALGVGLARLAVGIHYVADIMVGLMMGAIAAWGVLRLITLLLP
jgi:membrane-associated phospholipid phosphatase